MSDEDTYLVSRENFRRFGKYHTDADCPRIQGEMRPVDRDVIEQADAEECAYCAGDIGEKAEPKRALRWMIEKGEVDV